jgi:hypothetical protein
MAVGVRHRCLLEQAFQPQKAAAKPVNDAYFANLSQGIKILRWSDPAPSEFFSGPSAVETLVVFICLNSAANAS